VRRIGYQPATRDVELREGTATTTITMTSIPRQLDSVRIRAKSEGMRFSATVVDQNDQPVTGAEVVAMGIDNKIVTDSAGRFIIPKLFKGTLALRIRKMGYVAFTDSYRMLVERSDTLRMTRLATSLSTVEVKEQSGFGNDYWAYREMDQRARWKGAMAGVVAREELDAQGRIDICRALRYMPTGNKYGMTCGGAKILLNGAYCMPLTGRTFYVDEVETIEYFPRGSDLSGSIAARQCGPKTLVVWLRKDAKRP
jgi:carboxypeptidase family protein